MKLGRNIGTGTRQTDFTGASRRVWLYIYRVKRTATEETIKKYISSSNGFENLEVTVKEIPTTENQLRRYVVTAPITKKEEIYKPEFWPCGVGVKRFDFTKHKDFLKEQGKVFL